MRFALYDFTGGKGSYLHQRLAAAGHTPVEHVDDAELVLLDCDWPWAHGRPELITAAADAGVPVVLYPHGGRPTVWNYDGHATPDPRVELRLEHGPGSVELAALFGAEGLAQKATGWLFTPTKPFRPVDKPRKVLFAPAHPNIEAVQKGTNGHDPAPRLNQRIYRQLLALPDCELTVCLVGPPHLNGVWRHPRVRMVENHAMALHVGYEQIQDADAVVASDTMAAMSVAQGVPTVMFGQDGYADYINGEYREAVHADRYRELAHYPLDATDTDDLDGLLEQACAGDSGAAEWRARWVGDDGTGVAVRLLEELMSKRRKRNAKVARTFAPKQKNVTIEGATAKASLTGKRVREGSE